MTTKKTAPKQALFDISTVCAQIADGMTMTAIAEKAGASFGTLQTWIEADPERSARAREARSNQARYWDEKASQEIERAGDPFELSRAKELAHHYRWRAAKIAPKSYGERTTVSGDPDAPLETKTTLNVAGMPTEVLAAIMKAKDGAN